MSARNERTWLSLRA